ncbi:MAG: serine/threonine-protein kinase [Myxococcota bacterium]
MAEAGKSQETTETRPSKGAALPPGTLVLGGRFRIEQLLGGGGMGLVYAAEQVSLGRRVAVKVLREDLPRDLGFEERFKREALLLSSVEHPAVVRVIDFGLHEASMCLVMEYVEGETLEAVLRNEAPLSVARTEMLVTQLAQGLAAIHAKGIVHRDLKPENVILTRTPDGGEQARLLDFGIARLAGQEGGASVTQVGLVLGTPEYVSPEQALGQPLDARSDLYALAVIAFRMLTGRHPFPGPSPREFISQHIHQKAPFVLDMAPHLVQFPALVAAVMACLEKDPARRPQTATGLLEALSTKPLPLSDVVRWDDVPEPRRLSTKTKVLVGLGAVAVAALTALGTAWWNEPARKARRLVDGGRGSEALQVLEDMGEAGQAWPMQTLRAAAFHQVGRHDEEWRVMGSVPEGEALEAAAVDALADDFGHQEAPRLKKLMASLPRAYMLPRLQALAQGEASWAQWGALRFVDIAYAGQGLPLVDLYVRALNSRDCGTRRTAAKRLGELRSPDAVEPLTKLRLVERKKGDPDCGQDAATAALESLQRELAP